MEFSTYIYWLFTWINIFASWQSSHLTCHCKFALYNYQWRFFMWMYIVVDFPPLPRSAPPPLPPSRPPVPPRGASQPVHHHHQQQVRQMSSMHIVAEEWQDSSSYYASSAVAYGSFPASVSYYYRFITNWNNELYHSFAPQFLNLQDQGQTAAHRCLVK